MTLASESYLKGQLGQTLQFRVPGERVHASAEKVEHYLGESLREELAAELQQSTQDPHGREIPPERK